LADKGRVLVTGGCGFIGGAVVRELLAKGYTVRAFDLPAQFEYNPPPKEAEVYRGSILDSTDLCNAIEGCDYVMHLAALLGVRRSEKRRLDCLNINITGTFNVLDACVKEKVKKIIFASSSEVYGDQTKLPISESSPVNPKSIYAITKLAGEEYLRAFHERYGLPYNIVRYFNVYGPHQVAEFVMPRFVKNVLEGKQPEVYGSGKQVRSFCYVDDVAKGTVLALEYGKLGEIFNIGSDAKPISMAELAKKVIDISGKNLEIKFVDMVDSDRSSAREIDKRYPDLSKARKLLGYEPGTSLDERKKKMFEFGSVNGSWPKADERGDTAE